MKMNKSYKPSDINPFVNTLDYVEVTIEDDEKVRALLLTKENELKIEFFLRNFEGDFAIHTRIRELILRRIFNFER